MEGTIKAHVSGDVPNIVINIEKLDEERKKIISSAETKQKSCKYKPVNIIFQNLDNNHKHQVAEAFISKILTGKDSLEIIWKI